jgi:hypothetical protein
MSTVEEENMELLSRQNEEIEKLNMQYEGIMGILKEQYSKMSAERLAPKSMTEEATTQALEEIKADQKTELLLLQRQHEEIENILRWQAYEMAERHKYEKTQQDSRMTAAQGNHVRQSKKRRLAPEGSEEQHTDDELLNEQMESAKI